nr:MAG TPA: hypothetical protein [Caudoviricetes sp.]
MYIIYSFLICTYSSVKIKILIYTNTHSWLL